MSENQVAKTGLVTNVSAVVDAYLPSIECQLQAHNIELDDYQKECGINGISALNELILSSKLSGWNDPSLDRSNLQDVIKKVAMYKLNAFASNREVYFQLESVNRNDKWMKRVVTQLEGDGNDALLRNFGVDVEKVYPYWAVRENDEFEYEQHIGIETTPPKWKPHEGGKVIRVVYPIKLKDGSVDYRIAERENVINNLLAHITNNLKNETFGICANRYKATDNQLKEIEVKRNELKNKCKNKTLDELINFEDVQKWISPAWKEPHSRESMILRKMRNNAISKFPKNWGSSYTEQQYNELTDETSFTVACDINDNANNGDVIDITDEQEETEQDGTDEILAELGDTPDITK